jgi:SNF2 family DNA or RNA helicase
MHFLRRFRFGGCLANDMGVGKTAQVQALPEARRELRAAGEVERPSLVVVPKSLIFNWSQEAARFTPQLHVLDHTGIGRNQNRFADVDLILTTYGTLRRDAAHFKDMVFDYVILGEAQAIKNANTKSHKAVRLLMGNHHLALSGTPVENHLDELWSLFEFLNPGLLGASSAFQLAGGELRNPSAETRQLLAHALRPFILRRTKEQVAKAPVSIASIHDCATSPAFAAGAPNRSADGLYEKEPGPTGERPCQELPSSHLCLRRPLSTCQRARIFFCHGRRVPKPGRHRAIRCLTPAELQSCSRRLTA